MEMRNSWSIDLGGIALVLLVFVVIHGCNEEDRIKNNFEIRKMSIATCGKEIK